MFFKYFCKTTYNRLNTETDTGIQLSSVKPNINKIYAHRGRPSDTIKLIAY